MPKVLKPWERQPKEGEIPYEHFRVYLRQRPPRKYEAVAEIQGKTYQTIANAAAKWNWVERATAYDNEGIAKQDEVIFGEREQIAREQLKILAGMRTLGALEVKRRLKLYRQDPDGKHGLAVRDAVALIRESITLERLIIGEATQRIEQSFKNIDLSKLDSKRAAMLLELLDEIGAFDGTS